MTRRDARQTDRLMAAIGLSPLPPRCRVGERGRVLDSNVAEVNHSGLSTFGSRPVRASDFDLERSSYKHRFEPATIENWGAQGLVSALPGSRPAALCGRSRDVVAGQAALS
jgi:hypothetical protein